MSGQRDWLSVGEQAMAEGTEHELPDGDGAWRVVHRPISRQRIEKAIEALEWVQPEGRFPMSPALAIQGAIRELRLPRVSLVAWHGRDGYATTAIHNYCVYGVEANYRDGVARVYVLDRGHDVVPLCVDFTEARPVEEATPTG